MPSTFATSHLIPQEVSVIKLKNYVLEINDLCITECDNSCSMYYSSWSNSFCFIVPMEQKLFQDLSFSIPVFEVLLCYSLSKA